MAAEVMPKDPKFYFELDGLRYGGRYLTIAEIAQTTVEIDRLTNGKYTEWLKTEDLKMTAFAIYAAVSLSRVVCVWPTGHTPIDFLASDDFDLVYRYWEAYQKAADGFRERRHAGTPGPDVG